jgi:TM2 domain-containing membrane protein YozV
MMIFEAHRKSTGAAYFLWFFLGFFGAHRFYLGRTGTGIVQLLLCLSVIGIIPLAFWWLIDAFRIPDMVRDADLDTIRKLDGEAEDYRPEPRLEDMRSYRKDPRVDDIRELSRRSRLR